MTGNLNRVIANNIYVGPVVLFHCEYVSILQVLQKKFDDFKRDVSASTERYTAANNLARRLVAEGHSDTVLIKEKQDAMRYTCCDNRSSFFAPFLSLQTTLRLRFRI